MPSSFDSGYHFHQNNYNDMDYSMDYGLVKDFQRLQIDDVSNQWRKSIMMSNLKSQDSVSHQSQNYSEDVRVESSEHVAEIVGKQGT